MDDGRTITRAMLWCVVLTAMLLAVLHFGTKITHVASDPQTWVR